LSFSSRSIRDLSREIVNQPHILIIDDDASICETLRLYFEEQNYRVSASLSAVTALQQMKESLADLVILDIRLSDMSGLDVLEQIKIEDPDIPVVMITAFHDLPTTAEAMRRGAFEYVHKPIDIELLEQAVARGLKAGQPRRSRKEKLIPVEKGFRAGDVIGKSREIVDIFKAIGLISRSRSTVLIEGETGTGKELIARAIHEFTDPALPFISVNCSAIVETLMESEFFGYEKGAFTGAAQRTMGKFENAGSGTLFLDEIAELPLHMQAKLLRVIQEKEFSRVGGSESVAMEARLVAATNRDLAIMVRDGSFREDLYYRLRVVSLRVPPLRERRSDIPLLVQYMVNKLNDELRRDIRWIPESLMQRLEAYEWKGNVRELENALRRSMLFTSQQILLEEHLPMGKNESPGYAPATLPEEISPAHWKTLDEMEKEYIDEVLKKTGGNRTASCRILGISHPTLLRKIRKYALS
jgi:two-component system, NtrC family, response regulator AtoC